jgi:hypothetical protein
MSTKNKKKIIEVAKLKSHNEKTKEHLMATKKRLIDVFDSIENLESKIDIFTKHL